MLREKPLAVVMVMLAAAPAAPLSLAQTDSALEEVIVTANRRVESLDSVAGSVSVIGGETFAVDRLDRLSDYIGTQPGVTLFQPLQNRATITTRGINTDIGDTQLTQEPTALYVDEMHVMPPYAALVLPDPRMVDIERVEFLRGPQGTLYGSGSLAGAIRIITKKPQLDTVSGSIEADIADVSKAGTRQRYSGVINMPIVEDVLAVRVAAYLRDEPGWVRNINTGARNSNDDEGLRTAVRWKPMDELLVDATYLYQKSSPEDGDAWNPELGKFLRSTAVNEGRDARLEQGSLRITWEYGASTFLSITNYQDTETGWVVQGPEVPGIGSIVNLSEPADSEIISQEFRWEYSNDALWWVGGAFYQSVDFSLPFDLQITSLADFVNSIIPGRLASDSLVREPTDTTSAELAVFADVTRSFGKKWQVSMGVRAFETESDLSTRGTYLFDFQTLGAVELPPFSNKTDDEALTWRVNLSWRPSDNWMFYGAAATGYRVGQVNAAFGPSRVDPSDIVIPEGYEHDESLNFELGLRAALLDERLELHFAAYHINWSDIQVDAVRPSDGVNFVANAGDAISVGLEAELRAAISQNLSVRISAAVQDAEIDSVSEVGSLLSGVVDGDTLPGAADYLASAGIDYRRPLGRSSRVFELSLAADYRSSSPNRFSNAPGTGLPNPSFAQNESNLGVRGRMSLVSGPWRYTLYGENLTDSDRVVLNTGALATGAGRNTNITLAPRTIGLRVSRSFN